MKQTYDDLLAELKNGARVALMIRHAERPHIDRTDPTFGETLALNACLSHGLKVPEEVAILGVDNNEIICENQTVPLSSVLHDHEEIGFRGAELLNRLMSGSKEKGERRKEKGESADDYPCFAAARRAAAINGHHRNRRPDHPPGAGLHRRTH